MTLLSPVIEETMKPFRDDLIKRQTIVPVHRECAWSPE